MMLTQISYYANEIRFKAKYIINTEHDIEFDIIHVETMRRIILETKNISYVGYIYLLVKDA